MMNDNIRNEINYILNNFSSEIINNFEKMLENKKITLESETFDLIDEGIPSSDVKYFESLLNQKKFQSTGEIIISLKLLREIKELERNIFTSTKLVCTRPDILSKGTDETDLVINEMLGNARKSITILGYLMTDGPEIKTIFEMIKNNPKIMDLKIRFIFDKVDEEQTLGKKYRSVKEIIRDNWDDDIPFPEIYTYNRKKSSLHAKVVIIDSKEIFSTSANMSERAIQRNFEVGIKHKGKPASNAEKIIDELIEKQWFERK